MRVMQRERSAHAGTVPEKRTSLLWRNRTFAFWAYRPTSDKERYVNFWGSDSVSLKKAFGVIALAVSTLVLTPLDYGRALCHTPPHEQADNGEAGGSGGRPGRGQQCPGDGPHDGHGLQHGAQVRGGHRERLRGLLRPEHAEPDLPPAPGRRDLAILLRQGQERAASDAAD